MQEMKIFLTFQKQAYAIFFAVILSLVRGITYSAEIGIALEPPMAILSLTFCADTYTQEIVSRRSEVWRLRPMKKRTNSIYRRIVVQEIFQNPKMNGMGQSDPESEICQFLVFFAAIAVTLGFWGLLSNLLSCLFRNMWIGIGICLMLWMITNSSIGDRCFGAWNLFSYTFRELENGGGFYWLRGKLLCIFIGFLTAAALPEIIEKRG